MHICEAVACCFLPCRLKFLLGDHLIGSRGGQNSITLLHLGGIEGKVTLGIGGNDLGFQAGAFQLQSDGFVGNYLTHNLGVILAGIEVGAEFRLGEGQLDTQADLTLDTLGTIK